MSAITVKTSEEAPCKGNSGRTNVAVQEENVIVKKTYKMAETMKKFPLPNK